VKRDNEVIAYHVSRFTRGCEVAEKPDDEVDGWMGEGGLPLPDPFPEYVSCPHCGEPEVEVWCYQAEVRCHQCGQLLPHRQPSCFGTSPICRRRPMEVDK
jgi:hypothetical protein